MPQGVSELFLELEGSVPVRNFACHYRSEIVDLEEKGSAARPVLLSAAHVTEQ